MEKIIDCISAIAIVVGTLIFVGGIIMGAFYLHFIFGLVVSGFLFIAIGSAMQDNRDGKNGKHKSENLNKGE